MTTELFGAIFTVVSAFAICVILHLVTKHVDTFSKFAIGYFYVAAWTVGVIGFAANPSNLKDWQIMSWFIGIAFLPAFPFGFAMERICKRRQLVVC